ncbi:protein-glutamate O-methyltransferase CheR [Thalassomonas viridans]|uniref:Chemotaxis protein methyltransferase n=1 Tax=Thalassomonas viridans TaxID=137584 RepID=A0AAE9Z6Z8_9GAMM|nr:protein-glutamate O-methyltransferase CheR [Thalassomonas viridans]WDE06428.1 protein-glutamate O-methyltransferase CheR [Thalassomonas viridans]
MLDTNKLTLSDYVFNQFKSLMFKESGVMLSNDKQVMVKARLAKRLRQLNLDSFEQYLHLVQSPDNRLEIQQLIDALTTNETSFFREAQHFEFLRARLASFSVTVPIRIWSAACSTGEEAYSLAMTVADSRCHPDWQILASDINSQVLACAGLGMYDIARAAAIPRRYLVKYCLKGVRSQAGQLLLSEQLKQHIRFVLLNLDGELPEIGQFHFIFLRNVLIYFNEVKRKQIIDKITGRLVPGGYLFIGHSESLRGITELLKPVQATIYQKC